ncbi:catalase-related domain-containing protein [Paenibacillus sp. FSL R5-0407]|uniref:catalase-related domain-containing protein n=1 Tax=Paenibacillus sp. FSL R5-0407 TaxID=2975320 RepID=UPI0030F606DD
MREKIDRTNDFGQAGQTYRSFDDVERDELISNLVNNLKICKPEIQETWISHFMQADQDYGKRVKDGLDRIKREGNDHVSTAAADEALKKSEDMGHESDRY